MEINTPSQYTGIMTGCILTGSGFRDEEGVAIFLLMRCWMMLCEVVCKVLIAGLPVDDESVLFDPVANPVEAHVHGTGFALLEGVICDARGG
jgi:hypothetical protein